MAARLTNFMIITVWKQPFWTVPKNKQKNMLCEFFYGIFTRILSAVEI